MNYLKILLKFPSVPYFRYVLNTNVLCVVFLDYGVSQDIS